MIYETKCDGKELKKKMDKKFKVERYFCERQKLEESLNEFYKAGYYPKEIKIEPYQNKVEGIIIYELIKDSK